jgi:hypothetical protein
VWTEDVPGMANNWYFVMPNMYGVCPDGSGGPFIPVLQSNFEMGQPSAGTAVSSGIALQLHLRMGKVKHIVLVFDRGCQNCHTPILLLNSA